ncbi:hypothetical protein CK203_005906 [Vitis vinifera]|uniref:Reverse transcriptase zinc-binding domain-containing protein n=1 Tax=Vitis vinifera TaxID=29760 RepID=A0A438K5T1_VITVI|nr:hypothetical protein CK203_005906 [Vitis vinifera]
MDTPTTYLGLPLGPSVKSVVAWDVIEEMFLQRLTTLEHQAAYIDQKSLSQVCQLLMYLFVIPKKFHDWELEVVGDFLTRIQKHPMKQNGEDSLVWKDSKEGNFSVKSFYTFLKLEGERDFSMKVIWNSWIPTKMKFFAWEAVWDRIFTLNH